MFRFVFRSLESRNARTIICNILRHEAKFKYPVANISRCFRLPGVPLTLLSFLGLLRSVSVEESERNTDFPEEPKTTENLIIEADDLYNENKHSELYDLLYPHKDSSNVEILWRLSRLLFDMSKLEKNSGKKRDLVFESYNLIKRALKLDETNYAVHKWYSILLDARASYDGIKYRVTQLENVKKHMLRAIELNPKDATTLHILGIWCYNISAMPWYQRKIASTIFATPPSSSFEEALTYFARAEEVDPNFYSQNLLMLGKTYLMLQKEEKARYYLNLASLYPARTDDDLQARKEAAELLKSMKK